ncbi:MFS transporter [Brevibacterium sediminis]|uniref:MFS transporter n=1 Tax=Brevibacterium sediminis TaxID=1857024 RepID=A0A5C4WYD3_9MICO|nr:aromatic acid/H+ symport family MFS transporter [Brevibacterium sediminis]TNM53016.1 aromatic acid/H+ symport family MFS transporter [Brevibacterium sediminis]GGC44884.1 MFS transporter [Brevibacterium sediminis]
MTKLRPPTWAILLICWVALLCDGYDLYVYGATLPGFLGDPSWGVTKSLAGTVGSIALVGMLLGSLAAGTLTDRLGRRKLLMTSLGIFSIGMILCAVAPNFTVFAIFRFITCIGVGGVLPTAVAIANESAPKGKVSLAVGAVLTGPPVGSLVGALTATALVVDHGVRPVYALGGLSIILLIVVWRWMPESEVFLAAKEAPVSGGHRGASVSRLFTARQLVPTLLFWIVCAISMLTMFGITTWLPVIMQGAGFAAQSSIAFLSIYSVGCIIGTVVIAWIAQQSAPKYMVILGFSIAAMSLLAVSMTQNHLLLFVAIFFAGVGGMGTQNMINDHIAQYYPAQVRATGLGWALAAGRLGAIAGPTYGAVAATVGGSPGAAAMWFAIPAVLGAVAAVAMPLRDKTASTPTPKNTTAEGVSS